MKYRVLVKFFTLKLAVPALYCKKMSYYKVNYFNSPYNGAHQMNLSPL